MRQVLGIDDPAVIEKILSHHLEKGAWPGMDLLLEGRATGYLVKLIILTFYLLQ